MSEQTIYSRLTAAGMTAAGAAGLMGNMQCESGMRANNAQDCYGRDDVQYTADVDSGEYTVFARDAVGYGLCQWTYHTRKAELLAYARERGTSIGDEDMQVEFAVRELKSGYPELWAYLCVTDDVANAAARICREYERPAVNNIDARAKAAWGFYDRCKGAADVDGGTGQDGGRIISAPTGTADDGTGQTGARHADMATLCIGFDGTQVKVLRALLLRRGYDVSPSGVWEESFDAVLRQYQRDAGLAADGYCGVKTWAALMKG